MFENEKGVKNSVGRFTLPAFPRLEPDRNHLQGGRSFYFFDFDENIAFLDTPVIIFEKQGGAEKLISGREFSHHQKNIGVHGVYKNYRLVLDDHTGSFRNYRDQELSALANLLGKKQKLLHDIKAILKKGETHWQGPSWSCFYHAVLNKRPVALITARGHAPETMKQGIRLFVKYGYLPHEPNYLGVYPVNYPPVRKNLYPQARDRNVSELKKRAIKHAFQKAIQVYGDRPHRFGMSDDDPGNVSLITQAMHDLKMENPHISFFVIDTAGGRFVKKELGTFI